MTEKQKRGMRTDGVLGRVDSLKEIKMAKERNSTQKMVIFAYDHPEAPLGKVFHCSIHASLCWKHSKELARDDLNEKLEKLKKENSDIECKHVIGRAFWIYRYEFELTRNWLGVQEALARILSGDWCDKVEELEVSCIWYERRGDGSKFVCESAIGVNDPNPKVKRIGRYGKKGNAENSRLL